MSILAARTIALVGVLAAVLPGAAAATMRWSHPETLSKLGATAPTTVVDSRGNVLAMWAERHDPGHGGIAYRWHAPRAGWGPLRFLDVANRSRASVVLTPFGRATAVWLDSSGRVVAADARAGQPFGDRQVVANPASSGDPFLVADDAGNLVAGWSDADNSNPSSPDASVDVATRAVGGRWSGPRKLANGATGLPPAIATNAAGAVAVAWSSSAGTAPYLSYRPPGGDFAPPERAPFTQPGVARLALNDAGEAILTMPERFFRVQGEQLNEQVVVRSPLGAWGEPVMLDPLGTAVQLFAEPDGAASFLVYEPPDDPGRGKIRYVSRMRDGSIRGPIAIAAESHDPTGAMNLRGDILVAWVRMSGEGGHIRTRVAVTERLFGAVFTPELLISEPMASAPQPALNDAGQAAVAWTAYAPGEYDHSGVQASVREDPTVPALPLPPTVEISSRNTAVLDREGELQVTVRCSRACKVRPLGTLYDGKSRALALGSGPTRRLRARTPGRIRVGFGSEAAEAVRKTLAEGRRPWVTISVRARGSSPRAVTFSRRLRLGG